MQTNNHKETVDRIKLRKGQEKLVVLTCYDYTTAKLVDPHVDIILVGDSVGMVVQGEPNTLSVTVDQMIYHGRAVSRALQHAHLVVDMPFMSYQLDARTALKNAGRLLSEGRAESVKLEGGVSMARTIERLVVSGIPVMGHIGLTPQSVHAFGGFKVQGRTEKAKESLMQDAMALEDAGAYAIVLEGIPAPLAAEITERVRIPTIGIGAGVHCDGQVLVSQDLLGMNIDFSPRFVKKYAELSSVITEAVRMYADDVKKGQFPQEKHSF